MTISDEEKKNLEEATTRLIEGSGGLINWTDIGAKATELSMFRLREKVGSALSHYTLEQLRFIQELAQAKLFPSQQSSTANVISMHEHKNRKGPPKRK